MSFVTVLKTANSCNKVWDGKKMSFSRPFTQAAGYTQRIDSVDDLHSLIKRMSDKTDCVLIPGGYFPQYAEHDQQFNIMAATEMKRRGIDDVAGVQSIGGNDYIARLKSNMKPSNVILWDYDQADGMPDEWLNKTPDELVLFMRSILGEQVGFVAVESTSARCKELEKGKGCHLYCLVEDAADLERFKAAWMAQGFARGWSFLKPTHCRKDIPARGLKAGNICAHVPWGVFDPSVLASCERLDFIGKPDGKGVIEVLPAKIVLYDGIPADTSAVKSLNDEQHKQVKETLKTAGISLTSNDAFNTSVVGGISLSDSIETEAGDITIGEFISGHHEKLRCQIPSHIRDSSSWNGILRMTDKGTALLYDQGTRTRYFLPDYDVANIESNAIGWGEPIPLPDALLPVDSFNLDMLPSVFRDYAADVSNRMQCPIDFVAVSIMTTFGGVVGKRCSIYPKAHDDWVVIANLWGSLVGRPSSMKSPTITAATAGVDELVKEARAAYAEACEQSEVEKMVYDAEKKSFKDAITKAVAGGKDIPTSLPDKPCSPTELRYITNAGTVENLIKLLSENENGIIQLRDELMGWIRSMDNPSSQDARSFYLEAWNGTGSSFSYDTMSHGHLCLETGACVSVLGGIQPSLLAGIVRGAEAGNVGDDGMLQRFQLLVYPDKAMSWKYCDRKPNKAFSMALKSVFKAATGITGKIHFDSEAQPVFIEWYSALMHRLKHEDHLGMESHLSKYPQLMPAIALLIHIAEHAAKDDGIAISRVTKRAALKAVAWCDYLETHARRIYAMGDSVGVDAAYKVIDAVISGRLSNPFKVGELQCKKLGGLRDADSVNEALSMLENYGWLKLESVTTRGRPSVICHVHPQAEYFRKRPATPASKASKGGKSDFTGFTDTPSGTYSKNNGELESDSKENLSPDIGLGEVGAIGADGKIIMPSNDDESTTKQVRYF